MTKNKIRYNELCRGDISSSRRVVISECSCGGYTVAQQLLADENGQVTSVFLKGAFHIDNKEALENLRDALSAAIEIITDSQSEGWE